MLTFKSGLYCTEKRYLHAQTFKYRLYSIKIKIDLRMFLEFKILAIWEKELYYVQKDIDV